MEPQQSLALVIPERGIMAPDTVTSLEATFGPLYARADDLMRQASLVKVTTLDQLGHMQTAKTVRLQLRGLRGEIAAAHKAAKEESLKKGRAIDLIKNTAVEAIGKAEDYLLEQEEFKVRWEKEQRDGLRADRLRLLGVFADLIPPPTFELADLSTEDFTTLLEGTQARHEKETKRLADEAEAKRQQEQADKIERDRLEAENAKLKAEQETQATLRKTRQEHLAKQDGLDLICNLDLGKITGEEFSVVLDKAAERRKERIAQQSRDNLQKARDAAALKKLEDSKAQLKRELDQKNAEDLERQAQVETETRQRETEKQQAASAPDAEKLAAISLCLEAFRDNLPELTSQAGNEIRFKLWKHIDGTVTWIRKQQATLE